MAVSAPHKIPRKSLIGFQDLQGQFFTSSLDIAGACGKLPAQLMFENMSSVDLDLDSDTANVCKF